MNLKIIKSYEKFLKQLLKKGNSFGAYNNECPICLEPFEETQFIERQCGHGYHPECIRQWTETMNRNDCPVCRSVHGVVVNVANPPRATARNLNLEFESVADNNGYETDEDYGSNGRLVNVFR